MSNLRLVEASLIESKSNFDQVQSQSNQCLVQLTEQKEVIESLNEQLSLQKQSSDDTQKSAEEPKDDGLQPSTESDEPPTPSSVVNPTQLAELQYKLSWYEDQWESWTATYNELQLKLSYQPTAVC